MISLKNPIPEQIRDPEELSNFLKEYSIIPYFGYNDATSHSLMTLIRDLSRLSPSHQACKNDISKYAFSSEVRLIQKPIPGLKMGIVDLPDAEAIRWAEWLREIGITLPQIIAVTRDLYDRLADSGNAYLHIKIVRVGGTIQVSLNSIPYIQAAYLATKRTEQRQIIMTEKWDEGWWKIKPPTVAPASQIGRAFAWKGGGNMMETVVHFNNLPPRTGWYGFPPTLKNMFWMFVEFSQSDLATKISNTEFVTKKIIAFEEVNPVRFKKGEEDDKAADFKKKMRVLKELTTNEGDFENSSSLGGIEYPYGQKPPTAIDLEVNRDTEYADWVLTRASKYIYSMHGWYPQLTGMSDMKSNIGGNIVVDLFNVANVSTVMPLQVFWRNAWSQILAEIGTALSIDIAWTVNFENLIGDLVENLNGQTGRENLQQDEDDPDTTGSDIL